MPCLTHTILRNQYLCTTTNERKEPFNFPSLSCPSSEQRYLAIASEKISVGSVVVTPKTKPSLKTLPESQDKNTIENAEKGECRSSRERNEKQNGRQSRSTGVEGSAGAVLCDAGHAARLGRKPPSRHVAATIGNPSKQ